jgi:uncharacterized protein YbjT (DUF2867 family)
MILVTGAAGLSGSELVRRLSARGVPCMAEVAEKLSTAAGKRIRYVNVSPEDAKKA